MKGARNMSELRTTGLARRLEDRQVVQVQLYTPHPDVPLGLHAALTEALVIEENVIIPEATLTVDLGVESIDILDIVFRLEHFYAIEIPRTGWFAEDIPENDTYAVELMSVAAITRYLMTKHEEKFWVFEQRNNSPYFVNHRPR